MIDKKRSRTIIGLGSIFVLISIIVSESQLKNWILITSAGLIAFGLILELVRWSQKTKKEQSNDAE